MSVEQACFKACRKALQELAKNQMPGGEHSDDPQENTIARLTAKMVMSSGAGVSHQPLFSEEGYALAFAIMGTMELALNSEGTLLETARDIMHASTLMEQILRRDEGKSSSSRAFLGMACEAAKPAVEMAREIRARAKPPLNIEAYNPPGRPPKKGQIPGE